MNDMGRNSIPGPEGNRQELKRLTTELSQLQKQQKEGVEVSVKRIEELHKQINVLLDVIQKEKVEMPKVMGEATERIADSVEDSSRKNVAATKTGLFSVIKNVTFSLFTVIADFTQKVTGYFVETFSYYKDQLLAPLQDFIRPFKGIFSGIAGAFGKVKGWFGGEKDISDPAFKETNGLLSGIKGILGKMSFGIGGIKEEIDKQTGTLIEQYEEEQKRLGREIKDKEGMGFIKKLLFAFGLGSIIGAVIGKFLVGFQLIGRTITGFMHLLTKIPIINKGFAVLADIMSKIGSKFSSMVRVSFVAAYEGIQFVVHHLIRLLDFIKKRKIFSVFSEFISWFQGVLSLVFGLGNRLSEQFIKMAASSNKVSSFVGRLGARLGVITNIFSKTFWQFKRILDFVRSIMKWTSFMGPLFSGIKVGIRVLGWPLQILMSVIDFIRGYRNTEGDMVDKIKGGIKKVLIGIFDIPLRVIGWLLDKGLSLFGLDTNFSKKFSEGFSVIIDKVFGVFSTPFTALAAVITSMKSTGKSIPTLAAEVGKGIRWIASLLSKAMVPFSWIFGVLSFVTGFIRTKGGFFDKLKGGLKTALDVLLKAPVMVITFATQYILGLFGVKTESLYGKVSGITDRFMSMISFLLVNPFEFVFNTMKDMWNSIKGLFDTSRSFKDRLKNFVKTTNPMSLVTKFISGIVDSLSEIFGLEDLRNRIFKWIYNITPAAMRWMLPDEISKGATAPLPVSGKISVGSSASSAQQAEMEFQRKKMEEEKKRAEDFKKESERNTSLLSDVGESMFNFMFSFGGRQRHIPTTPENLATFNQNTNL